jgi:hypothetical protein
VVEEMLRWDAPSNAGWAQRRWLLIAMRGCGVQWTQSGSPTVIVLQQPTHAFVTGNVAQSQRRR